LAVVGSLVHLVERFADKQGQRLGFWIEQVGNLPQDRLESKNQVDVQSADNFNQ
jgi:hypothetical protein